MRRFTGSSLFTGSLFIHRAMSHAAAAAAAPASDAPQQPPPPVLPRKKHMVLLGYNGQRYAGMQRNPHARTVEGELLQALLTARLVNQQGFDDMRTLHFMRTARTDAGVSAVRQVRQQAKFEVARRG